MRPNWQMEETQASSPPPPRTQVGAGDKGADRSQPWQSAVRSTGEGQREDHPGVRWGHRSAFPKSCQSREQKGQGRWTAAFRLSLGCLEGDTAPGLDTVCRWFGGWISIGVLQQAEEILVGYFLCLSSRTGYFLKVGSPFSQDLTCLTWTVILDLQHTSTPKSTFQTFPFTSCNNWNKTPWAGRIKSRTLYFCVLEAGNAPSTCG